MRRADIQGRPLGVAEPDDDVRWMPELEQTAAAAVERLFLDVFERKAGLGV